jgi:hypothetical protein
MPPSHTFQYPKVTPLAVPAPPKPAPPKGAAPGPQR